jgi:hypothetical protein
MCEAVQNVFYASEIRIRWAGEKLDELKLCIERAADDAFKASLSERSEDRMKLLFHFIDSVTEPARRLVSEYALHARAALDYIIFTLAELNTGSEQDGTQFPINSLAKDFPKKPDGTGTGTGALRHLTAIQIALVERFQPYNGFSLLQVLNKLSNRDKHREFVHIAAFGTTAPVSAAQGSPTSDQMSANFRRSLEIVLHDGNNALDTLRIIQTDLRQILDAFTSLFQS